MTEEQEFYREVTALRERLSTASELLEKANVAMRKLHAENQALREEIAGTRIARGVLKATRAEARRIVYEANERVNAAEADILRLDWLSTHAFAFKGSLDGPTSISLREAIDAMMAKEATQLPDTDNGEPN